METLRIEENPTEKRKKWGFFWNEGRNMRLGKVKRLPLLPYLGVVIQGCRYAESVCIVAEMLTSDLRGQLR
jgi:hypothetical protein